MEKLINIYYLLHPLIDLLGVISLVAAMLISMLVVLIWFIKTFYAQIIAVFFITFCLIILFLLIT